MNIDHSARKAILYGAGIVLISLLLRVAYVNTVVIDTPIRADARTYLIAAHNLHEYGVFSHHLSTDANIPPPSTSFITPGYPFFLAANLAITTTVDELNALITNEQAVLGALTIFAMYAALTTAFSPGIAFLLTLPAAFSPHWIAGSGYMLTECLFTFALVLSLALVCFAIRRGSTLLLFASGISLAAACTVRPAIVLLPVFFVALFYILPIRKSEFVRYSAGLIIGFAVIWTPWVVWKASLPESPDNRVSNAAASFSLGSYPNLIHETPALRGLPYVEDPTYSEMVTGFSVAARVVYERASEAPLTYAAWYLVGKPMTFLEWSILVGAGGPFIYPVKASLLHAAPVGPALLTAFRGLHPALAYPAVVFCIIVLLTLVRRRSGETGSVVIPIYAVTILYFLLVHTVLAPLPRYAIPIHGLLYVNGLVCIGTVIGAIRRHYAKRKLLKTSERAA